MLSRFRTEGYHVHVSYLWLNRAELAVERVADRVRQGGHSIPEDVIHRRFLRGLGHFLNDYAPSADSWTLFDNTHGQARTVAFSRAQQLSIVDEAIYQCILRMIQL